MLKLKNINLGYTDGEEEALNQSFLELYYENIEIIKNVFEPRIYLILGKKGTGKTVLSHYIQKTKNSHDCFINRVSYGDLTITNLTPTERNISNDDYYYLFQWIFLSELTNLILQDESLYSSNAYNKLKKIYDSGLRSNMSSKSKFFSDFFSNGIKLKAPISPLELEIKPFSNDVLNQKTLPVFVDEIKEHIQELLFQSATLGTKYLILIDDIDDHISLNDIGKKILSGLINAIYGVNFFIRKCNPSSKIILMIRNEVFNKITTSHSNKLKEDHSLILEWDKTLDWYSSNILDIVTTKINQSLKNNNQTQKTKQQIYKQYFSDTIQVSVDGRNLQVDLGTFLLSRTFFRPRDVIKYLKTIQSKYGELEKFSGFCFPKVEQEYSMWFKKEIESEMIIHFEQSYIDSLFEILKRIPTPIFDLSQLKKRFTQIDYIPDINIELALEILYDFGALTQYYRDEENKKTYLKAFDNFEYSKDNPDFFVNNFELHYGLRKFILRKDYFKSRNK